MISRLSASKCSRSQARLATAALPDRLLNLCWDRRRRSLLHLPLTRRQLLQVTEDSMTEKEVREVEPQARLYILDNICSPTLPHIRAQRQGMERERHLG